ncbi:MAG: ribonuclease H-like domain-containing protein [Clostridia bacterium]|nr:ribonuclease H-like domain-containing protein [Clostridia bacterium]
MNLRDKLRAIDASPPRKPAPSAEVQRTDCRCTSEIRPVSDFPGFGELNRETLMLMQPDCIPDCFDPYRILYMDTETTGLGGSGSVAFLVGVGRMGENGFEIRQYLMRDYPEEPYLLEHVAEDFGRFDLLCTFNGRSFDVPLLESRFRMNRMNPAPLRLPHLDLLYPARRLWKLRLGHCTLGDLEARVLGIPRTGDLPGSEVPQRYFSYLKTGQLCMLDDVLTHNAQDIATLCVLLCRMAHFYRHPEELCHQEDTFSMGRALEKTGHHTEARRCYRLAEHGRVGGKASGALARSWRRAGETEEAVKIWQRMIETRKGGVTPYIELAKYHEHRTGDLETALDLTRRAMILLYEPALYAEGSVQDTENALKYRYDRLKRKIAQKE